MREKLTLKDVKFIPRDQPPHDPIKKLVEIPSVPPRKVPQAVWLELPPDRWLRVVLDSRIGMSKRIFRIEMFNKDRDKRLAVFRRQTEAMRQ